MSQACTVSLCYACAVGFYTHTKKESATIPAQMFISHDQLVAMADLDLDVVVTEGPGAQAAQAIDVWVLDQESMDSNTHRSVIMDPEGNIISDSTMGDDE